MKPVIYVHVESITIGFWESSEHFYVNLCHPWIKNGSFNHYPQHAYSAINLSFLLQMLIEDKLL
jgi:hypothetical protein